MSASFWITIAGLVIPALGLSGSAIAYVIKLYRDAAEQRRSRFFEMMKHIDGDGPIAAKLAAIYSLREFREHSDFVERFCTSQRDKILGGNASALQTELDLTASSVMKK